jgi:hypothetical protein
MYVKSTNCCRFYELQTLTSQMPEKAEHSHARHVSSHFSVADTSYNIPDKREYTCRNINTEQLGLLRVL